MTSRAGARLLLMTCALLTCLAVAGLSHALYPNAFLKILFKDNTATVNDTLIGVETCLWVLLAPFLVNMWLIKRLHLHWLEQETRSGLTNAHLYAELPGGLFTGLASIYFFSIRSYSAGTLHLLLGGYLMTKGCRRYRATRK